MRCPSSVALAFLVLFFPFFFSESSSFWFLFLRESSLITHRQLLFFPVLCRQSFLSVLLILFILYAGVLFFCFFSKCHIWMILPEIYSIRCAYFLSKFYFSSCYQSALSINPYYYRISFCVIQCIICFTTMSACECRSINHYCFIAIAPYITIFVQ